MNLSIPAVGVDPGPEWATDLNNSLTLIDQHDHSPGYGVAISPAGLNINSDLSFGSNNAISLRSVRFTPQSAILSLPADIGCIYEVNADLYYNDGVGNQIRITQAGSIAGSPGSITNLTPPASVSYVAVNETFVFQSDVNTPANLDAGSITVRDVSANSNGITIEAPPALASNYDIILPAGAPSANGLLLTSSSGTSLWQSSYDAIVGSTGQVANGQASHTSLTAAITAAPTYGSILVLNGAYTDNPTVSKTLTITGQGYNTVITGNLSVVATSYCNITGIRLIGNLSLNSASNGNVIINSYIGSTNTALDNGSGNYILLVQG